MDSVVVFEDVPLDQDIRDDQAELERGFQSYEHRTVCNDAYEARYDDHPMRTDLPDMLFRVMRPSDDPGPLPPPGNANDVLVESAARYGTVGAR